mmetsp:Transcript_72140/g.136211  ORF Transcript_72140/g.136211 Transcript_72140/m.136211 type:complete len:244 (+) Transcript_72140:63-794(+)
MSRRLALLLFLFVLPHGIDCKKRKRKQRQTPSKGKTSVSLSGKDTDVIPEAYALPEVNNKDVKEILNQLLDSRSDPRLGMVAKHFVDWKATNDFFAKAFKFADADKDKFLTKKEIVNMGIFPSMSNADAIAGDIVREFDDGDGFFSEEEFETVSREFGREYRYDFGVEAVQNDFKTFDKDKSGYLDAKELVAYLNRNFNAGIAAKYLEVALKNKKKSKASLKDLQYARAVLIKAFQRRGGREL